MYHNFLMDGLSIKFSIILLHIISMTRVIAFPVSGCHNLRDHDKHDHDNNNHNSKKKTMEIIETALGHGGGGNCVRGDSIYGSTSSLKALSSSSSFQVVVLVVLVVLVVKSLSSTIQIVLHYNYYSRQDKQQAARAATATVSCRILNEL